MSLVALIGLPNSGKSALFNSLTQGRQRVANFPGITTEKKIGTYQRKEGRETVDEFQVLDLPGIYSLDINSLDEKVTKDYIFEKNVHDGIDKLVLVMDATNFRKSLYLALQLKEIGRDFIVAFNMFDIAEKRNQQIQLDLLSSMLGEIKIIPTVAVEKKGIISLVNTILTFSSDTHNIQLPKNYQQQIKTPEYIKSKLKEIDHIVKQVTVSKIEYDKFTEKIDSIVLHPFYGPLVLFTVLLFTFQLLFVWSEPFVGIIEGFFGVLSSATTSLLPNGLLSSLITEGIIPGVGGILVFLPHIIFLFVLIYFLEGVGYLGRAAFLLDFLMRKFGLPGKAVVPLLSSHACAIPGIMSARIIEDPKQRILTMMVAPLMTCSARLPVYTLLIGVIIPKETLWGFLSYPGLVLFGLYFLGMASAFLVAFASKKSFIGSSPAHLMMELPPYRMPKLFNITRSALGKGKLFIKKAGTIILLISIIIWGLVSFPKVPLDKINSNDPKMSAINYSYAATIGKTFQPLFAPLGFDWKITTALIPSFGAREVLVATMGTVYAVEGRDTEDEGFLTSLTQILSKNYSFATIMSLLIWFVFAPQCISTFAVLKKESGGLRVPLIYSLYTLVLAYFFAFITYRIFL